MRLVSPQRGSRKPPPRYRSGSVALARPVADAVLRWALVTHKHVTLDLITHMAHTMQRHKMIKVLPAPAAVWVLVARAARDGAAVTLAVSREHRPAAPYAPSEPESAGSPTAVDPIDLDTFLRGLSCP